jgi:hypothetical protein
LNQRLGSLPTKSKAEILPRCGRDYLLPPPINRGSVNDRREEKIGSKVGKNQPPLPSFCSFSLSLSLSIRRSSHQPKPPSASTSLASPHLAIPTTSQPPPHLKQPPFLPLSHFCRSLPLLPVNDSGHRSSQKRCQNHQLILLITAETPALSKPLLRQPPVSATISVACRT